MSFTIDREGNEVVIRIPCVSRRSNPYEEDTVGEEYVNLALVRSGGKISLARLTDMDYKGKEDQVCGDVVSFGEEMLLSDGEILRLDELGKKIRSFDMGGEARLGDYGGYEGNDTDGAETGIGLYTLPEQQAGMLKSGLITDMDVAFGQAKAELMGNGLLLRAETEAGTMLVQPSSVSFVDSIDGLEGRCVVAFPVRSVVASRR
jgi:hypothetical protein